MTAGNEASPAATKTSITVIQGKVDVVSHADALANGSIPKPQTISLSAGQKIIADAAATTPIKTLTVSPSEMSQMMSTVKINDNTFQKAITLDLNTGSSNSGVTNTTQQAVQTAVAAPPPQAATVATAGNSGMIGTFGAGSALLPAGRDPRGRDGHRARDGDPLGAA